MCVCQKNEFFPCPPKVIERAATEALALPYTTRALSLTLLVVPRVSAHGELNKHDSRLQLVPVAITANFISVEITIVI